MVAIIAVNDCSVTAAKGNLTLAQKYHFSQDMPEHHFPGDASIQGWMDQYGQVRSERNRKEIAELAHQRPQGFHCIRWVRQGRQEAAGCRACRLQARTHSEEPAQLPKPTAAMVQACARLITWLNLTGLPARTSVSRSHN